MRDRFVIRYPDGSYFTHNQEAPSGKLQEAEVFHSERRAAHAHNMFWQGKAPNHTKVRVGLIDLVELLG